MRGNNEISNSHSVIDSRDVIDRIKYLEQERQSLEDNIEDAETEEEKETAIKGLKDWDEDGKELKALISLQDEAEGYVEGWKYGATLIRESYFVDYCKELLEDIGDLPKDIPWYIAIDWDQTAENLKSDYTVVDFGGVDYYIR